jgi:hypothetical protein
MDSDDYCLPRTGWFPITFRTFRTIPATPCPIPVGKKVAAAEEFMSKVLPDSGITDLEQ